MSFVPDSFIPPEPPVGNVFRLEPLGPQHNESDHDAWGSSLEHIRSTPGFAGWDWPYPMSLEDNQRDLEAHASDFEAGAGFTYSVLIDDEVIGCVYIYPTAAEEFDAAVRSWVSLAHAETDVELWRAVSEWLERDWPFEAVRYADRVG